MEMVLNDNDVQGLPLDLPMIFGNSRPLHVDIGFGKGKLLLEQTVGNQWNFLGIEKRRKYIDRVATRLTAQKIANVRLISGYAEELLPRFIAQGTIDRFSILFPDPWEKRRHNKRRI